MDKISLDPLKDLVAEEGISDSELEVLSLVLQGKSPQEIQTLQGIPTKNAVQKKLSQIYAKFRLSGAGPGKLPKLQKILRDRLQAKQAKQGKKKVLLFWSSSRGKRLAEGLRDIFQHPQADVLVSNVDMSSASVWLAETKQLLGMVDFGFMCLTKGISKKSWINLAAGFLSGQIPNPNFKLVRFSKENLPDSLFQFPTVDGTNEDNLAKLLHEIVGGDLQEVKDWVDLKVSRYDWWKGVVKEGLDQDESADLKLILKAGQQMLKNNGCFRTNQIFRQLIENVLTDIDKQLEKVGSSGKIFAFPLELYPRYLTSLQQHFQRALLVKAVAVIDSVEHFWASDEGDRIGETANPENERLFVFPNEDKLNKSTKFLLKHASRYQVFVTTLSTYLSLMQEFSKSQKLSRWKNEDYSLPTQEYAILKTSDNSQLLAWYDEDNIKDIRNKRLANISAITEQVNLYEAMFEEIKKSQGVFTFSLDKEGDSEKISNNLEQLQQGLFRRSSLDHPRPIPRQLLEKLLEVRIDLLRLTKKDEIIQKALEIVREELQSQTASIFLFGKDGRLHREKILGVDVNGKFIEDGWFADESYAVGQSFTGKAAALDGYGKPQLSNSLDNVEVDERSSVEYEKKLGKIHCGMAVPLNGQNNTFGVLEVLNKVEPNTQRPLAYCGFDPDEIYLLSAIGSSVANAISNYRRDRQSKLYTDLANFLINPPSDPQIAYDEAVKRLTSEETAFKVCILRELTESDFLEVKAFNKEEKRLIWEKRNNEPIKIGEDFLICQVAKFKQPKIIDRISEEIDKFTNQEWIEDNQFKSFGSFPLIYQDEVVGTLSVYTEYEYKFHSSCQRFLERVASLIAAFIRREKDKTKNG